MGVMRPREPAGLVRWRDASRGLVGASRASADLFTEYLISGGPDAIKSLQATIRRLQLQLEEQKADGRLERFRKLQKDLEECDKVRAALRDALVSSQWTDDEVDAYLSKRMFKASQLYGASRELLLRENRLLRSQLEEHHVTSRTSRPAAAAGNGGGGTPSKLLVAESRLKQARMMQGPHMESVSRLLKAAEELEAAEQAYRLPSVAHAEVQADDGSRKYIQTLEQQMATLAGQKMQLMNQVASLTEQNRVLDMKLEGALDQVSELRRQKTEMLAHADNLSKDLRDHLLSEAKRADVAETSLAEARLAAAAAREAEAEARKRMDAALAEAGAMQAALQEKTEQVDTLRGLYLELRETLEKLAGDVASGQQDMARRLLDATNAAAADQRSLLLDVKDAADGGQRAAAHSAHAVEDMSGVQRVLVGEMAQQREVTLGAYERQLAALMALLQQSEADRVRLARQAIAASALNRVEDKRHQKTVALLLHEVPGSVAERLAPELGALAEGTAAVADGLAKTQDTLAAAGIVVPGLVGPGPGPDLVEDETTRLLGGSKALRSQLHNLAAAAPGPPLEGAGAQTLAGQPSPYAAGLFKQLPPGMEPLQPVAYYGSPPVGQTAYPPPLPPAQQQLLLPSGAVPSAAPGMATPQTQAQTQPLPPHQQQQLMYSPPDRFAGGAVGSPGDLAVAWYPPGMVPPDSGGPPGYPAAPSYLSGRRALGMTSPNQWDDVPYIDQFQYNYQPLQQVGGAEQGGGGVAHVDLVLQLAPPPPPRPELLAEAEAARLLAAGDGPAGWYGPGPGVAAAVPGGPPHLPPGIGPQQAWAFEPLPGSSVPGAHSEPAPPPPAIFLSLQPLQPAQPHHSASAAAPEAGTQAGHAEHPAPHQPTEQAAPAGRPSASGSAAGPGRIVDAAPAPGAVPAAAAPAGHEPGTDSHPPAHPAATLPPPPPPPGPPPPSALSAVAAPPPAPTSASAPAAHAAAAPPPPPPPPPPPAAVPPPAHPAPVEAPQRNPPSAASLSSAPGAGTGAAAAAVTAPLTKASPAPGAEAAASKPAVAAVEPAAAVHAPPPAPPSAVGSSAAAPPPAHKPTGGPHITEIEPAEEDGVKGVQAGAAAAVAHGPTGSGVGAGGAAGASTAAPGPTVSPAAAASGLLVLPEVMEVSKWTPAPALRHFAPP